MDGLYDLAYQYSLHFSIARSLHDAVQALMGSVDVDLEETPKILAVTLNTARIRSVTEQVLTEADPDVQEMAHMFARQTVMEYQVQTTPDPNIVAPFTEAAASAATMTPPLVTASEPQTSTTTVEDQPVRENAALRVNHL